MIIYGDSYTSGENNGNISFADYLGIESKGVSGTCLDEYSIYPVHGESFVSLYQKHDGIVLLEYGINDAASLTAGYVADNVIRVAVAKTADLLKDNDAYFLALTEDPIDLDSFCARYTNYLRDDYLKGLYPALYANTFRRHYEFFISLMRKKFKTLYMLPSGFKDFDEDGIHPTDKGYKIIAEYLKSQFGG